jgi:hypothetical protein
MSLTYFHKAEYELTNHMLQVLDCLELRLEGGSTDLRLTCAPSSPYKMREDSVRIHKGSLHVMGSIHPLSYH